jgi:hypothetical protein
MKILKRFLHLKASKNLLDMSWPKVLNRKHKMHL